MTLGKLKHRTDGGEEPQSTRTPRELKPAELMQQSSAGKQGKITPSLLRLPPSLAHTVRDSSKRGSA